MNQRAWPRIAVSGVIVLITAGVVVFIGSNAAEGEPDGPAASDNPLLFTLSPEQDAKLRQEERERASQEAANSTPYVRTSVTIRGRELDLPDGMTVSTYGVSGVPGTFDELIYVDPSTGTKSDMSIEIHEGTINWLRIRPEHEHLFDPFVQAAGGWPSPTPVPTPVVARLGEHEFVVPQGMYYDPPSPRNPYHAAIFAYVEPLHVSRVYIDENGEIIKQEILPDHAEIFQPLLEEFSSGD